MKNNLCWWDILYVETVRLYPDSLEAGCFTLQIILFQIKIHPESKWSIFLLTVSSVNWNHRNSTTLGKNQEQLRAECDNMVIFFFQRGYATVLTRIFICMYVLIYNLTCLSLHWFNDMSCGAGVSKQPQLRFQRFTTHIYNQRTKLQQTKSFGVPLVSMHMDFPFLTVFRQRKYITQINSTSWHLQKEKQQSLLFFNCCIWPCW